MYRSIIEQFKEWKNKEGRKPLILSGARQVGKTHILKRFREQKFATVAYINCDDYELAKNLFMQNYNIHIKFLLRNIPNLPKTQLPWFSQFAFAAIVKHDRKYGRRIRCYCPIKHSFPLHNFRTG